MKRMVGVVTGFALAASAQAALHTEPVEYKHGGTTCQGYLAYDTAVKGKRPGVLVLPEWWGLNDYAKRRAGMLAQLGYVAFAADMYGDGFNTTSPDEAGKHAAEFRTNRALMRERVTAALDVLRKQKLCDPKRIAAIGYCFGGTCVLELARSGADIAGVVSFHGGLSTPNPADAKNIKCKVLVCHGANDTFESPDEVTAFQKEMREANVDWQMNVYGGAVHSFTNPDSGKFGIPGVGYNERADKRSWEAMRAFFAEIFR
ncbi:MAG TPA: dienelactone hydrolase family protein [Verrucomicrobiae bacterium]|nr:dienelactone hydrolase family protein [Verrucomicrobiae bacterium]